jgi:chromosome segregation ATPase
MKEKDDRIAELESALRLNLAVAPDDPVLITTAEKQIAALTAAMKEKDGLLWATEEANKDMRAEIAALQLYKDATLGKESERERQIITLKAEIAEITGKLRGEQIRNHDIGEQMDTLTADNSRQAEEIAALKTELKTPCYCCRESGCQDGCRCKQDDLKEPEVEGLKPIILLNILSTEIWFTGHTKEEST